MVWELNPTLTGAQVKSIIVNNPSPTISVTIDDIGNGTPQTFRVLDAFAASNAALGVTGEAVERDGAYLAGQLIAENGVGWPDQDVEIYNARTGVLIDTLVTVDGGFFDTTLESGQRYIIRVSIPDRQTGFAEADFTNSDFIRPVRIVLSLGTDISVEIDGVNLISTPLPFLYPVPFIEDNRTLVPLRAIANALDFTVDWDHETRTAILTRGSILIRMPIGQNTFLVLDNSQPPGPNNPATVPFPDGVSPEIRNNYTFLPLRALGEAVGMDVDWDADTRTAILTSPANPRR